MVARFISGNRYMNIWRKMDVQKHIRWFGISKKKSEKFVFQFLSNVRDTTVYYKTLDYIYEKNWKLFYWVIQHIFKSYIGCSKNHNYIVLVHVISLRNCYERIKIWITRTNNFMEVWHKNFHVLLNSESEFMTFFRNYPIHCATSICGLCSNFFGSELGSFSRSNDARMAEIEMFYL